MAARTKKGRRTTRHDAVATVRFRPNCVKVWTPGQLNKATNRHGPKPSFGLSNWGLKRLVEGSRLRTEPRKHPKWRPRRLTVSVIRQQPRKNANFASGDLSKDRKSSETSARNRVKIDSDGPIFSQGRCLGSGIEYRIARPRAESGRGGLGCVGHDGTYQSLGKHRESFPAEVRARPDAGKSRSFLRPTISRLRRAISPNPPPLRASPPIPVGFL